MVCVCIRAVAFQSHRHRTGNWSLLRGHLFSTLHGFHAINVWLLFESPITSSFDIYSVPCYSIFWEYDYIVKISFASTTRIIKLSLIVRWGGEFPFMYVYTFFSIVWNHFRYILIIHWIVFKYKQYFSQKRILVFSQTR